MKRSAIIVLSFVTVAFSASMAHASTTAQVPEPSTLLLIGSGLAGLGIVRSLLKK